MRIRPGILIAVVAVFAVLIGGRYLGWFGSNPKQVSPNGEASGQVANETPTPTPVVPGTGRFPGDNTRQPTLSPPAQIGNRGAAVLPVPTSPDAATIVDWEQRIDDVLTAQEDENQKANRLLEIFPKLPEDGQVEAAQHLSNLLADEQYASLAPTLTNALTPEAVLDVLMTDVLNRPNQIKLETLLDVARTPNHPKGEEARDVLEVFVDENFGEDWAAWDAAVKKWLKENPDE